MFVFCGGCLFVVLFFGVFTLYNYFVFFLNGFVMFFLFQGTVSFDLVFCCGCVVNTVSFCKGFV